MPDAHRLKLIFEACVVNGKTSVLATTPSYHVGVQIYVRSYRRASRELYKTVFGDSLEHGTSLIKRKRTANDQQVTIIGSVGVMLRETPLLRAEPNHSALPSITSFDQRGAV